MPKHPTIDKVGEWTEVKLQIIREYANAFATVLKKQSIIAHFAYIDGFAGRGKQISKATGEEIPGSAGLVLDIKPHYSHYHFIDIDPNRTRALRELAGSRENVMIYEGDCNRILLDEVFPQCEFKKFRRALCVLDPYDLAPDWGVFETAGKMRSIEIMHSFMIVDANRNVLWRHPENVSASQIERMNKLWGDNSWREFAYVRKPSLFGDVEEKTTNWDIIHAFSERLKVKAGFKFVAEPIPMRNSTGSDLYYIIFATNNKTGYKIASHIMKKYSRRGVIYGG